MINKSIVPDMSLPLPGPLVQIHTAILGCLALRTVSALRPLALPRSSLLAAKNCRHVPIQCMKTLLPRILPVREAGYTPKLLARGTQRKGMATLGLTLA